MRAKRARRPKFFTVTVPRRYEPTRDRVIGFAVAHDDGKGMNIFLDAMPTQGQFTVRDPSRPLITVPATVAIFSQ